MAGILPLAVGITPCRFGTHKLDLLSILTEGIAIPWMRWPGLPTAGILPRAVGITPCKYGWPPLPGNDLSWLLLNLTFRLIWWYLLGLTKFVRWLCWLS